MECVTFKLLKLLYILLGNDDHMIIHTGEKPCQCNMWQTHSVILCSDYSNKECGWGGHWGHLIYFSFYIWDPIYHSFLFWDPQGLSRIRFLPVQWSTKLPPTRQHFMTLCQTPYTTNCGNITKLGTGTQQGVYFIIMKLNITFQTSHTQTYKLVTLKSYILNSWQNFRKSSKHW